MTRRGAETPASGPSPSPGPLQGSEVSAPVYRAFGHGLTSELALPELHADPGAPVRWRFGLMDPSERSEGGELLGAEPLYNEVGARLFRHDAGLRIEVDDTGVYDISDGGADIRWLPTPEPWWDFGRGHLLGRVLSTAMHFDGLLVLHGSAVQTAAGTVAFLGVKGSGKSTLALSMVEQGGRLVTDDTLPVSPESRRAWPGIHSLRLVPGSSEALMRRVGVSLEEGGAGRDGKVVAPPMDETRIATGPTDLRAIYIVEPAVSFDPEHVVARTALDPLRATAALAAHAKIGRMLGPGEAATLLDRASTLATSAPVRLLVVHRDPTRISEVASQILEWHAGPPGPPEAPEPPGPTGPPGPA